MKKILFLFGIIALALGLSACTSKPDNEQNQLDKYNINVNVNNQINNLQNNNADTIASETPVISETGTLGQKSTNNEAAVTSMRTLDNQKDLAAEYSQAIIKTSLGNITVKFYSDESPITVNNFMNLAQQGFYNGTKFHRVIKDFMIQGGDPNSKGTDTMTYGTGGPGYKFADEFNNHKLVAGSLAMANAGPGTNGSQFFIVTATETPWLDGHHTNFGEVTDGMDIVKKIEGVETGARDIPVTAVTVNSVELKK